MNEKVWESEYEYHGTFHKRSLYCQFFVRLHLQYLLYGN